jgi:hypothetical protein
VRRARGPLAALALALALGGCGAVTHPRYAPDLAQRWPECDRVVVIPGTIHVSVKNYLADDFFQQDERGNGFGLLLADGIRRVLHDETSRQPLVGTEVGAALGNDPALIRSTADRMLEHARTAMARTPDYPDPTLSGLAADPAVVPRELRRGFDAIVVVGGRVRYETERERAYRFGHIAVRNLAAVVPALLAIVFPPLAVVAAQLTIGTYWQEAPNATFVELAIFDAASGRLLYATDWSDDEKVVEREEYHSVAEDLLRPIARVRAAETPPPLGEKPAGWRD